NVYYLGDEDDGARKSGWLWLEAPDADDDDEKDAADAVGHNGEDSNDPCDEEGWYYFGSDGKMYKDAKQKKINGKYYYFNAHGQMLYEWINGVKTTMGSNAQLDTDDETAQKNASPSEVRYMNQVEEGWRADGWYQIDGADILGAGDDTDWYYFDDGEAKRADSDKDFAQIEDNDETPIWRAKIKIKASNNKYFCFDEVGRMQTGLQYIPAAKGFYYFDDNGYMKTGKVTNVEDDDDSYTFYFNTKNGKNGEGVNGEKDNYLYFSGKRLEADDDYRLYLSEGKVYLVNNKGKIQKSKTKKYDIENFDEEVTVAFGNGDSVKSLTVGDKTYTLPVVIENVKDIATMDSKVAKAITVPEIKLYDNTYSYGVVTNGDIVRTWVAEADTDALSLN
ncbi:glucan-binding protein, partial [Salmonella enterica subsp. enterica serovar Infantis]|nr:glucan-binding protein [Salmonella enterica subsp. enterica serovar Infantis]